MGDDPYVEITATFARATAKAIMLKHDDWPGPVWVPRSVLHGADERAVDGWGEDQQITVRVRRWLAVKNDLI